MIERGPDFKDFDTDEDRKQNENGFLNKLYFFKFNPKQVNQMLKFYRAGYDLSDFDIDADKLRNLYNGLDNNLFSAKLQAFIYSGLENHLNIFNFADEKFNNFDSFDIIKNILLEGYDTSFMENPHFTREQITQIYKGLKEHVDISVYANPEFTPNKMEIILKGLINKFDMKKYLEFNEEQLSEIYLGLSYNEETKNTIDITRFANKDFSSEQMKLIRENLMNGINVDLFAKPSFNLEQMEIIAKGLNNNSFPSDLIPLYADCKFSSYQMQAFYQNILNAEENNFDKIIDLFIPEYDEAQMLFLGFCINNNIDIKEFSDPEYTFEDMLQIEKFLSKKKDIDITIHDFKLLTSKEKNMLNNLLDKIEPEILKSKFANFDFKTDKLYPLFFDIFYPHKIKPLKIEDNTQFWYRGYVPSGPNNDYFLLSNGCILEIKNEEYIEPPEVYHYIGVTESYQFITSQFLEQNNKDIYDIIDNNIFISYDNKMHCFLFGAIDPDKDRYITKSINDCNLYDSLSIYFEYEHQKFLEPAVIEYKKLQIHSLTYNTSFSNNMIIEDINSLSNFGLKNLEDKYIIKTVPDAYSNFYLFVSLDDLRSECKTIDIKAINQDLEYIESNFMDYFNGIAYRANIYMVNNSDAELVDSINNLFSADVDDIEAILGVDIIENLGNYKNINKILEYENEVFNDLNYNDFEL